MSIGSVAFDETAEAKHREAAEMCVALRNFIGSLAQSRAQALAITKLEECFMWIGAALRDDQIKRQANQTEPSPK
jgi:hypothetical protein